MEQLAAGPANITLRHVLFSLYLIRKFHVKLDSPDSFYKKTEDLAIIFPHSHWKNCSLEDMFSQVLLFTHVLPVSSLDD